MIDLRTMLAGIVDSRLDGAACAGMSPLFDPREPDEPLDEWEARRGEAIYICSHCPIANACADVAAQIPKTRRAGVWAGRDQGDES